MNECRVACLFDSQCINTDAAGGVGGTAATVIAADLHFLELYCLYSQLSSNYCQCAMCLPVNPVRSVRAPNTLFCLCWNGQCECSVCLCVYVGVLAAPWLRCWLEIHRGMSSKVSLPSSRSPLKIHRSVKCQGRCQRRPPSSLLCASGAVRATGRLQKISCHIHLFPAWRSNPALPINCEMWTVCTVHMMSLMSRVFQDIIVKDCCCVSD